MRVKKLISDAKEQSLQVKQLVMKLLSEPMAENQKEIVLSLYKLVK
jgi:hypothetical protein